MAVDLSKVSRFQLQNPSRFQDRRLQLLSQQIVHAVLFKILQDPYPDLLNRDLHVRG